MCASKATSLPAQASRRSAVARTREWGIRRQHLVPLPGKRVLSHHGHACLITGELGILQSSLAHAGQCVSWLQRAYVHTKVYRVSLRCDQDVHQS